MEPHSHYAILDYNIRAALQHEFFFNLTNFEFDELEFG